MGRVERSSLPLLGLVAPRNFRPVLRIHGSQCCVVFFFLSLSFSLSFSPRLRGNEKRRSEIILWRLILVLIRRNTFDTLSSIFVKIYDMNILWIVAKKVFKHLSNCFETLYNFYYTIEGLITIRYEYMKDCIKIQSS